MEWTSARSRRVCRSLQRLHKFIIIISDLYISSLTLFYRFRPNTKHSGLLAVARPSPQLQLSLLAVAPLLAQLLWRRLMSKFLLARLLRE